VAWLLSALLKKAMKNPATLPNVVKISDRIVKSAIAANEVISAEAQRGRNIIMKFEDGELTKGEVKAICAAAIDCWKDAKETPMLFKKIWSEGSMK
jgi:hypothetical protein